MIEITLNGEKKQVNDGSIKDLLDSLGLIPEKIVVEKNLEIIPRTQLCQTSIASGDQIEIVHFVGGGAAASKLVIVESPAKCKTIQKFLGSDYDVAASMGHVIDLPKSKMGVDVEKDFEPRYVVTKERKKTLSELKKKAKSKKEIILACDPDREGEAISWHLSKELGAGKKVCRVVFNEITKEAIKEAFKHPREINQSLVDAQQARRVLDRLVGYSLSPLLWQKVGKGLSAGRVQTVALRLIVEREKEIKAFTPQEYWSIEALLQIEKDNRTLQAKLEKHKGEKIEIHDQEQASFHEQKIRQGEFLVRDIKETHKKRNPYPPFTTSKLQQAAYNRYRFPASKTMKIAQELYEGVDIGGEGGVGLITYMRTDSVRIADTALSEIRDLIARDYGQEYLPAKPNVYRSKKQAQEAHEAIRPSSVNRKPSDIESFLTPEQMKLYSLIWEQAVSSQMLPAQIVQTSVEIENGDYIFKATGSRIEFQGCLAVHKQDEDDESVLPELVLSSILPLMELSKHQHFTKPPARFTDASLVKVLEENGIGRPSTYAPTIATLTYRDYVVREGGSLVPTELGILVADLLVAHFQKLFDYEFTANMEEDLDKIEEENVPWVQIIRQFYSLLEPQVQKASEQMVSVKQESEKTNEVCEKCSKPMVIKWGRRGRFMSCSGWPECQNAKSLPTGVACPSCKEGFLVQRRARTGRGRLFYGCSKYPQCTFIANRLPKDGVFPKDGEPASGDGVDHESSEA